MASISNVLGSSSTGLTTIEITPSLLSKYALLALYETVQNFGPLKFLKFLGSVDTATGVARFLNNIGLIKFVGGDVQTPVTLKKGESKEFYEQYTEIVNTLATLEAN